MEEGVWGRGGVRCGSIFQTEPMNHAFDEGTP